MVPRGNNDAANQWLSQHPLVLGAGALVLGLVIIAFGVSAVSTGQTRDKYGRPLEGANARAMGVVRLVFGTLCALFGVVKIISGL